MLRHMPRTVCAIVFVFALSQAPADADVPELITLLGSEDRETVLAAAFALAEMGAEIRVHDPYVDHWYELEIQDEYPVKGLSWERFFRNQGELAHVRVQKDLPQALKGMEALVLAVPHEIWGFQPEDGKLRWYCEGIPSDSMCSSAIAHEGLTGMLFVVGEPVLKIRTGYLNAWQVKQVATGAER